MMSRDETLAIHQPSAASDHAADLNADARLITFDHVVS